MLLTTVCGAVREYVFARVWGYIAKEISPIINKKLMHRKKNPQRFTESMVCFMAVQPGSENKQGNRRIPEG